MKKAHIIPFGALAVITITVIFIIVSLKTKETTDKTTQDTKQQKKKSRQFEKAYEKQKKMLKEYERKQAEKNARTKEPGFKEYKQKQIQENEATKRKFLNETYLNMNLPERFNYSEMDIDSDEPVKMIVGKNPHKDEYLMVGATPIIPEQEQNIVTFINEYKNLFPHMDKSLISRLKLTTKVKNPQPGFKQVNVWEAHNPKTNRAEVVVYLPRSDGRGSYIFSYSGESSNLEDNEDYIDEIFKSLSPKDVPQNIYDQYNK